MKKKYSLKSKIHFNNVLKNGKKIHSSFFLLSYLANEKFEIGISIPKKLGNAVFRNYNKRIIKTIIPKLNIYEKKISIVIIVRKSFINLSIENKTKILQRELKKVKINEKQKY